MTRGSAFIAANGSRSEDCQWRSSRRHVRSSGAVVINHPACGGSPSFPSLPDLSTRENKKIDRFTDRLWIYSGCIITQRPKACLQVFFIEACQYGVSTGRQL